ncbi:hypothetical protein L6172_17685 [Thalassospiraceae bacterium SW-3-3]|nr:hypothetical protein L6172_17685 [Thalassospiraceae bacterium SW-3-3]
MDYGDFSANADAEETFFPCQRQTIPILPVRFSLLPYDLEAVQKPTSISNPGSYMIRTLRRGFVYVYVEHPQEPDSATDREGPGSWYVFRFDTKGQDINSDFVPDNTESYHRADYSFTKYEWTDHYGEDEWKYDTSMPPQKTIWVPKWSSKIWLAYSEYRWPPAFFRKGHQESYRSQLMQPVNLRGQNRWAAYIGKASELVEEYKPQPMRNDPVVNARLNLSQVKFTPTMPPQVADECAIVAVLYDPLGDVREMQYRLAAQIKHKKNFAAAHEYPLTIGRLCQVVKDQVDPRDGWIDTIFGNDPAFAEGWEDYYNDLVSTIKRVEDAQCELVEAIQKHMADTNDLFLGKQKKLAFKEKNDPDSAGFGSMLLACEANGLGATAKGHLALCDALKNDGASELQPFLKAFLKSWGGFKIGVYEKVRRWQVSFDGVIEAFALELAVEGSMHQEDWRQAFQNVYRRSPNGTLMTQTVRLSYPDAVKFLQGAFSNTELENLVANIDSAGTMRVQATDTRAHHMPDVDVPAVEIDGKLMLVGGLNAERNIVVFDGASAGIGLLLGAWSLFELAKAEEKGREMFAKGQISGVLTDNNFALATTAVGIADGLLSFGSKMSTAFGPTERIAQDALSTLYKKALPDAAKKLAYAPRMAIAGGVGRTVSTLLPRVSIVLGALMSFGAVVRGYERKDKAEIIGNSAMLVGTVLLGIPGLNVVVMVGAALIIAVGFTIALLSYTQLEDVVRKSFWGRYEPYWELPKRKSFSEQIAMSENLPENLAEFYNEELQNFQDLLWGIGIENQTEGDGVFTISSPAFNEEDPGNLSIKVMLLNEYVDVNYNLSNGSLKGFNKHYVNVDRIAGAPEIRVQVIRSDSRSSPYHDHTVVVEYTRSETGKKLSASSGKFRSF